MLPTYTLLLHMHNQSGLRVALQQYDGTQPSAPSQMRLDTQVATLVHTRPLGHQSSELLIGPLSCDQLL